MKIVCQIDGGSFHVNLANWCHPGSGISNLIFFGILKKTYSRFVLNDSFWSWPFVRIMAVGHWTKSQNRDSWVFSSSPWIFWSKEHNHALYWKFGTLAGLGSRPQAQMTMDPIQKTFLVLGPFEGALTCSILIAGTQVMLRKAYFLRRGSWLRPETWTSRPRIQNSGPYYWDLCYQQTYIQNFSSLGAISAEK
jgi:hypothetical protein